MSNLCVLVSLWDTAGQERYASLARSYYRGAQAALVVFDVTQAASFVRAKKWIAELQGSSSDQIIIALIGNKIDLPIRQVSEHVCDEAAKSGYRR